MARRPDSFNLHTKNIQKNYSAYKENDSIPTSSQSQENH